MKNAMTLPPLLLISFISGRLLRWAVSESDKSRLFSPGIKGGTYGDARGNPTAWDHFYKTARWQGLPRMQLRRCKFCLERGIVAANVVDHVVSHRGDWTAFVTANCKALFGPCHSKREIELRGHRTDVGLDGLPTDPNYPFNRAR